MINGVGADRRRADKSLYSTVSPISDRTLRVEKVVAACAHLTKVRLVNTESRGLDRRVRSLT